MTFDKIIGWCWIEAEPEITDIYFHRQLCDDTLFGERVPVSVVRDVTDIIELPDKIAGSVKDEYLYHKYCQDDDGKLITGHYNMIAFPTEKDVISFCNAVNDDLLKLYFRDNSTFCSFSGKDVRTGLTALNHLQEFYNWIQYKGLTFMCQMLVDRLTHDIELVEKHIDVMNRKSYHMSDYTEVIETMKKCLPEMKEMIDYNKVVEKL